jgi:galactokinase
LVIDTMAHHELTDGGYAERRENCHRALGQLGFTSMRDLDIDQLELFKNSLGEVSYRRLRHAVTEIARVHRTVDALSRDNFDAVGEILNQSHQSLRDDYEVSCVELDLAVTTALEAGALGARMVGGGFGGSAIALIAKNRVEDAKRAIEMAFSREGFTKPRFFIATPQDGSRLES